MAITKNGEIIPVTIAEMEYLFDLKSEDAINDETLYLLRSQTNAEGKRNWLTLAKKYNRPKGYQKKGMITTITVIAAGVLAAYVIYNKTKNTKNK